MLSQDCHNPNPNPILADLTLTLTLADDPLVPLRLPVTRKYLTGIVTVIVILFQSLNPRLSLSLTLTLAHTLTLALTPNP